MLDIFFLRHAESVGNLQGIMQGRRDYALSEKGERQAQQLSIYLQNDIFSNQLPDAIYCSPLQRTRQTLSPLLEAWPEASVVYEEDLQEVDSGIFSGLNWSQALEAHPDICRHFKSTGDWGSVPEGESKKDLWKRAERLIRDLQIRHSQGRILVMTHGGFIRAALGVLAEIAPETPLFVCIDNASLSRVGLHQERRFIRSINDTRYLAACDYQADFIP